ncbi:cache domain-containing sensor histidine kinase [Cohnella abietis]|uniref:Putative two-component sensor kinase n=1 Tax=Cohnella abietis TaxID=2507935 RepID=A0A3T1CZF5_9BACL|nr:sensor histidine kinase [Cohnella abietis]BBI31214.1 putative two-component sensor kinase [Cohnella abietis]
MKGRLSYRNKLIISFMLVSLLPVLIVQMVSYYVSSDAMKRKIDVLVQANLTQTSKNLDTSLQAYEDLLFQIVTNDDVIRLLREINNPADDVELSKRQLINQLASYSYAKNGIRSVAIFSNNGTLISYDQQTGSPYDNLWTNVRDLTSSPIYQKAVHNQTGSIKTIPEKMDSINSEEQYGFHLARKLIDYNRISLDSIGVVVITVYESVLARAINLDVPDVGQAHQIDNRNFLTDGRGLIISAATKDDIGKHVDEIQTGSTISNTYSNPNSGWTIYNLIDQKKLFSEMYAMQRLNLIVGFAALLIAALLIFYFAGRLSGSIRKVVKAMRSASQGALTVHVEEQSKDEISAIAFNFNKMMNTINELMVEVKETSEKRKEAEIRALESQINPHFLYNSLDSINWLAIEKDEHQISHMLKGLAQILRYSIKDSNKLVTVREELEWMDRYIFLQQYRFRSSFSSTVERDEEVMDYLVPKLILQPFIENAIIHGFSGFKMGGELRIEVKLIAAHSIEWTIRDNGAGMEAAKLAEVLSESPVHSQGIGVRNVMDRLRMYYGEQASCEIHSHIGEGTEVRITMPAMQREGNEQ